MLKAKSLKIALAEAFGTFFLVLFGTGAIVVSNAYPGTIDHLGVSLTFGIIVSVVIYSIGDLSGAHINPAVTIAFFISGRLKARLIPFYFIAQFIGAIAASFLLASAFTEQSDFGLTTSHNHPWRAFITEIILSFFLMFVIIHVASGSKEKGIIAGLAIGAAVALDAYIGGPISGASMNPARSLGPAVASGNFTDLWIYLTAPFIGTILSIPVWKMMQVKS